MKVKLNLKPLQEILAKRGLEERGKVQQFVGDEVLRKCDPYVPFQSGILKNTAQVLNGGKQVRWNSPYAKFLYYGKVMVGVNSNSPWARKGERKVVTGKNLTYSGAPKRGSMWFERMKAQHGQEIIDAAAKLAGGRSK